MMHLTATIEDHHGTEFQLQVAAVEEGADQFALELIWTSGTMGYCGLNPGFNFR